MRECITHHACDCIQARVDELLRQLDAATLIREDRTKLAVNLKEENVRLQRLVDMNQKVVDAALEAREHLGWLNSQDVKASTNVVLTRLDGSLRELDGATTNVSSK